MHWRASVTAAAALLAIFAGTAATPQDADVARVVNGLMPAVEIAGQAPITYSLQARMAYYHVPAVSIAFFDQNGIRWARAYGATTNTLFQAGSISKPVSAVGIMHLVQQGVLKLDEPVNDELTSWKVPENAFTAKTPVTLRELLSHTAGVSVHGFVGYERGKPLPTLEQVLDGAKPANNSPIRVIAQPGTAWMYSGGGYTIAEQLVLDAVHQPFAAFMHDTVLAPFGMTESTFDQPLPQSLWRRAAAAYDGNGKPYPGKWNVYPTQTAAGLWTTPSDLARFAIGVNRALDAGNGVLSQRTAREMLTAVKNDYGLGFSLGGSGQTGHFGHNGANVGFEAFFQMYHDGEGVAIMTNADNGAFLIMELLRSFSKTYGWSDFAPVEKPLYALPASALPRYPGRYKLPGQTFVVAVRGGELYIKGIDHWLRLYPEAPDTFFVLDQPFDVKFNLGKGGKAQSLTVLPFKDTAKRVSP